MSKWWTTKTMMVAVPCLVALTTAGLGCSDGGENTGAGGTGGAGGGASSSSASTGNGGSGGQGGAPVDTMTDAKNCGTIGNQCAPGQTCAGGACTCGVSSVAFADVQAILTAKCATGGCHSGAAPKAGLDLAAGNSYAQLVDVPADQCGAEMRMRVKPGQPSESYVIDKVMNVDKCGAGNRMPPSTALPIDAVQTIADWICGGAMP